MIARAIAASVPFLGVPVILSTVLAISNSNYAGQAKATCSGSAALMYFNHRGKRRSVAGKAADIARTRRASDWKRLSGKSRSRRTAAARWCYLELADLEVEEFYSANRRLRTRGLLIRRHIADGDLHLLHHLVLGGNIIETLVAVEGHQWAMKDSFETAKNEFGLDHNEERDPGMAGIATFPW